MRKQTKRLLALLLALTLCFGLLPMAVMAEGEDGDGGDASTGNYVVFYTDLVGGRKYFETYTDADGVLSNFPENDPVKEGYKFLGWARVSDGTLVESGDVFDRETALYAKWELLGYILNLRLDGGTLPAGAGKTILLNSSDDAPTLDTELPVPTREGYIFEGWYLDGASEPVKVGDTFSETEHETQITARWNKIFVPAIRQIWFHLAGGTVVSVDGVKPDSSGSVNLPNVSFVQITDGGKEVMGMMLTNENGRLPTLPVVERDEYRFVGWYTAKEGGSLVTTDTYFKGEDKYDRDFVWARWEKDKRTVTVKFNLNYKRTPDDTPSNITVNKGTPIRLPDGKKLTPPGINREFYAWCMLGEDGLLYPWDESTPVTEDMTLYAGWIRKGRVTIDGEAVEPRELTDDTSSADKKDEKPAGDKKDEAPAAPKFTDVAADSPFAKAIDWAVEEKITNGTTPTTFSPGTTCSTGHILTFLWRSQGSPEPTIQNPYQDEIPGAFQKAAVWAHEKGLVTGDTFGSVAYCTRADAVTYMWKLAGSPEAKAASFKDVGASSDYAKAVSWAVEQGVTKGTGDGSTFSPDNTCTRGQIVTFLYRAYAK